MTAKLDRKKSDNYTSWRISQPIQGWRKTTWSNITAKLAKCHKQLSLVTGNAAIHHVMNSSRHVKADYVATKNTNLLLSPHTMDLNSLLPHFQQIIESIPIILPPYSSWLSPIRLSFKGSKTNQVSRMCLSEPFCCKTNGSYNTRKN